MTTGDFIQSVYTLLTAFSLIALIFFNLWAIYSKKRDLNLRILHKIDNIMYFINNGYSNSACIKKQFLMPILNNNFYWLRVPNMLMYFTKSDIEIYNMFQYIDISEIQQILNIRNNISILYDLIIEHNEIIKRNTVGGSIVINKPKTEVSKEDINNADEAICANYHNKCPTESMYLKTIVDNINSICDSIILDYPNANKTLIQVCKKIDSKYKCYSLEMWPEEDAENEAKQKENKNV